jgi:hypothetical protein
LVLLWCLELGVWCFSTSLPQNAPWRSPSAINSQPSTISGHSPPVPVINRSRPNRPRQPPPVTSVRYVKEHRRRPYINRAVKRRGHISHTSPLTYHVYTSQLIFAQCLTFYIFMRSVVGLRWLPRILSGPRSRFFGVRGHVRALPRRDMSRRAKDLCRRNTVTLSPDFTRSRRTFPLPFTDVADERRTGRDREWPNPRTASILGRNRAVGPKYL